MTAKNLLCVGLPSLLIAISVPTARAQDVPKTNDAAIEELKQEKQAAGAVAPVAEPKIEELIPAEAKPATPVAEVPKTEAAPAVAPLIEELVPAKVEEKKPEAAVEAPKVEAPKAEAAPAVTPIEELIPAKVEAQQPPTVPVETNTVVTPAAGPAVPPTVSPAAPERSSEAEAIANVEVVRRQADAKEGSMAVQDADKAWKDGDYAVALKGYLRAAAKLRGTVALAADRARAVERIPVCEYRVVLGLMKDGKNTEALAKATDASNRFPADKNLKNLKTKLEKTLVGGPPKIVDKGPGAPTEAEKQMLEGKRYMAARDYNKARASFESVLALDRDNREAMRYLKEVGILQFNTATAERSATASKMSAQVRDTWNPPQYRALAASRTPTNAPPPSGAESIIKKMERIIIPEIEFRQANIHDVIDFLNKASVEADKAEPDPSKKGINIILNLNPAGGGASAAPAAAKPGEIDFGGTQAAPAGGGGPQVPEITFTARYISMLSAMKIITSVAGLRYRVDGNIVMIVPADYDPAQIEVRMYPVEPTFIQRVTEARAAMPATATRGGREVTTLDPADTGTAIGDLKTIFDGMGVKFPKGASITYNSALGKVIVANTAENLAIFEKLLSELNVVPKQVEIEARFVEVNETDLRELGLEWLLNDNWELATKKTGAFTPLSATPAIRVNQNGNSGGFTTGLRFWGTGSGTAAALGGGQGTMGRILSVSSVLTNPELSTVLHALEQNGNADLLSAPKVTTRSGSEASIRVVTEYIYPTTFEVQGGQIGTGTGTTGGGNPSLVQETVVVPQDFQTREVGVILTVMPEVSPDGNMINLTMTPSVVTEPEWHQYGSTIRRADGSTSQLNMPQPFFHVRTLNTQISIYDGATVVMGGLITEDLRKVNDKVPLLGDIPLIGILFRSQSEQSVKKNLLIFVTARLVDPAGKAIRNVEGEKSSLAPAAPAAVSATP